MSRLGEMQLGSVLHSNQILPCLLQTIYGTEVTQLIVGTATKPLEGEVKIMLKVTGDQMNVNDELPWCFIPHHNCISSENLMFHFI